MYHMLHLYKNSNSGLVTLVSQDMHLGMEPSVAQNSSSWNYSQGMVIVPGVRLRLCSALPRRLRRGSRHRHLRLLRARWSRPGRPRALARKLEAGEARAEEEGIRAEVRAPGHRHPRAHSSGRTKGRHWGRSPSASGPTWAPLPRSASRPPRPAHCAGACGRQVLAGGEKGSDGCSQSRASPAPCTPSAEPGMERTPHSGARSRKAQRHGTRDARGKRLSPRPPSSRSGLHFTAPRGRDAAHHRSPGTPLSVDGQAIPEVGGVT